MRQSEPSLPPKGGWAFCGTRESLLLLPLLLGLANGQSSHEASQGLCGQDRRLPLGETRVALSNQGRWNSLGPLSGESALIAGKLLGSQRGRLCIVPVVLAALPIDGKYFTGDCEGKPDFACVSSCDECFQLSVP